MCACVRVHAYVCACVCMLVYAHSVLDSWTALFKFEKQVWLAYIELIGYSQIWELKCPSLKDLCKLSVRV